MPVLLTSLIVAIGTGSFDNIGSNCLEINSLSLSGFWARWGIREDFRMLIQNGFTRKYIFIATVSLYLFISGIMALVDTIMGNVLHAVRPDYFSLYGALYGYHNVLINWLWLFLVYMAVCFLLYLMILVINRTGKQRRFVLVSRSAAACCWCLRCFGSCFRPGLSRPSQNLQGMQWDLWGTALSITLSLC